MFLFISFLILPTHIKNKKQKKNWGLTSNYCAGQLCHSSCLPFSPWTPQGGGSLSVLLTLYKAGGACFPRLISFSHIFYDAQMVDFKNKKCLSSVTSMFWSSQLIFLSYTAPASSTLLHGFFFVFLWFLAFLSRVTLLCLLKIILSVCNGGLHIPWWCLEFLQHIVYLYFLSLLTCLVKKHIEGLFYAGLFYFCQTCFTHRECSNRFSQSYSLQVMQTEPAYKNTIN